MKVRKEEEEKETAKEGEIEKKLPVRLWKQ